jgi:hypothetical protein
MKVWLCMKVSRLSTKCKFGKILSSRFHWKFHLAHPDFHTFIQSHIFVESVDTFIQNLVLDTCLLTDLMSYPDNTLKFKTSYLYIHNVKEYSSNLSSPRFPPLCAFLIGQNKEGWQKMFLLPPSKTFRMTNESGQRFLCTFRNIYEQHIHSIKVKKNDQDNGVFSYVQIKGLRWWWWRYFFRRTIVLKERWLI